MVLVGQIETYGKGAELLGKLAGIKTNDAQLFRVTDHYGGLLEPAEGVPAISGAVETAQIEPEEVVYAEVDGSMILTVEGWKEVKLGRVFRENMCAASASLTRNGSIGESRYTAVLGTHKEFVAQFDPVLAPYADLKGRLVFLTDGALWIKNWIAATYPDALQILDFYHVKEHLGKFAQLVLTDPGARKDWLDKQALHLKEGNLRTVIAQIRAFRPFLTEQNQLVNYLMSNEDRLQYDLYLQAGLFIGSGAIEAAHRTVIQCRLKKSGQHWTLQGAQNMLNLRVAYMSNRWDKVVEHIRHPFAKAA